MAQRIKKQIEMSGLSKRAVARGVGVSDGAVHKWCSGENAPSHANLTALAGVLGCDVNVFFGGETQAPVDQEQVAILKELINEKKEVISDLRTINAMLKEQLESWKSRCSGTCDNSPKKQGLVK